MIKVLVAEDEMPLLRGIRIMIEQINPGFSVVKCALNGKEAVDYLKENSVDVIFTDINMPLLDGIDLMKFAHERYPEIIMVAISGYNDFHYAQQAIEYQVKRYLLKPIVKEDLEPLLNEIQKEYKSRCEIKQRDRLVDAIYSGKRIDNKERVWLLYLCAGPFIERGMEESIAECGFWRVSNEELKGISYRLLPVETAIYIFEKNQPNERIMLLLSEKETDVEGFARHLVEELDARETKATVSYCPNRVEMRNISMVCRTLRADLKEGILFGEGTVITPRQGEALCERPVRPEDVLDLIESEFRKDKQKIIWGLFEALLTNKKIKQSECMRFLSKLIDKLGEEEGTERLQGEDKEEIICNLLLYSPQADQLLLNLQRMFGSSEAEKRECRAEDLMPRVETYIREHMTEPITAKELAAEFGLVAPYLGRLFKEYIGYTPAQYIQKLRIERAKYLLSADGDILTKDVAEMVGYPDPAYFSKLFKKKVGVWPSEYKSSLCNSSKNNNKLTKK
ncbi:MAG: response regulator [Kineothrix sp.]